MLSLFHCTAITSLLYVDDITYYKHYSLRMLLFCFILLHDINPKIDAYMRKGIIS